MKFFKNRRKALIQDIANEVVSNLESKRGWKKFLPPVAVRDTLYMVTEDGSIYAMRFDTEMCMEIITTIKR